MKFLVSFALVLLLAAVLLMTVSNTEVWAQPRASSTQFHVSGQALPASLTSPTPIEGRILTTSVNVDFLIIANTDTSAHTVTVSDCTPTTPFLLYNGYTIPAGTTWLTPIGNTRFTSCFKWTANSTTVMGTVVGTR